MRLVFNLCVGKFYTIHGKAAPTDRAHSDELLNCVCLRVVSLQWMVEGRDEGRRVQVKLV